MQESEAIKLLANWNELIDPRDCDALLFYLSAWISEVEDKLTTADGVVAQRRLTLIEAGNSVAKANVYLACEESYKQMLSFEKQLRSLKAARSNVRRRFDLLVGNLK